MRKIALSAAAAAMALSAHALASPFALTASSDDDHVSSSTEEKSDFVDNLFDATASAFGVLFKTNGESAPEDLTLKYYDDKEGCPSEDGADDEIASKEDESKTPSGPEPLYFGF